MKDIGANAVRGASRDQQPCCHCRNGWLEGRFGMDVECVNGVLIDIDEATEGWRPDTLYPAAPCESCETCQGAGCRACKDSGWKSGKNESQERLEAWAARGERE